MPAACLGRCAAPAVPAVARTTLREALTVNGPPRFRWPWMPANARMHCHHEKTIVIDDRIAFVGGVDLTSDAGDRYDTRQHHGACAPRLAHPGRFGGPAVADVADHFNMRWTEVTGELKAPGGPAGPAGEPSSRFRTIPEKIYKAAPDGDFGILESYARAFDAAEGDLPREPVPLVARDLGHAPSRRSRTRRQTISGSSCCCRRGRTRAPTILAGCSILSRRMAAISGDQRN